LFFWISLAKQLGKTNNVARQKTTLPNCPGAHPQVKIKNQKQSTLRPPQGKINNPAQPQKLQTLQVDLKQQKCCKKKIGCRTPLHPACCWFNKKQPVTSPHHRVPCPINDCVSSTEVDC